MTNNIIDDAQSCRPPIVIPSWVPSSVADRIREIETRILTNDEHARLALLATNTRMDRGWKELRRMTKGGTFLYPATNGDQEKSMDILFHDVWRVVCDGRRVTRAKEVAETRECYERAISVISEIMDHFQDRIANLMRRYTARRGECSYIPVHIIGEVERLKYLITAQQVSAEILTAEMNDLRGPDDPLTVKNDRDAVLNGDDTVRGVQRQIAVILKNLFGSPLGTTATMLTEVGLGLDKKLSRRGARL
jgi:hypothetical protein